MEKHSNVIAAQNNFFKNEEEKTGLILDQNCIRLSGTALYYFFSKYLFNQKQCKYAINIGVAQIRDALLKFILEKKCPLMSLLDAAFSF